MKITTPLNISTSVLILALVLTFSPGNVDATQSNVTVTLNFKFVTILDVVEPFYEAQAELFFKAQYWNEQNDQWEECLYSPTDYFDIDDGEPGDRTAVPPGKDTIACTMEITIAPSDQYDFGMRIEVYDEDNPPVDPNDLCDISPHSIDKTLHIRYNCAQNQMKYLVSGAFGDGVWSAWLNCGVNIISLDGEMAPDSNNVEDEDDVRIEFTITDNFDYSVPAAPLVQGPTDWTTFPIILEWNEPAYSCDIVNYVWKIDGGEEHNTTNKLLELERGVPDGDHVFSVKAMDDIGESGEVGEFVFRIDETPPQIPDITLVENAWLNNRNPIIEWGPAVDEHSGTETYRWKLDQGEWQVSSELQARVGENDPLDEGEHIFYIMAVDRVGNEGEIGTLNFSVDVTSPIIDISMPQNGTWFTDNSMNVSWIIEESGAGLESCTISIDGGEAQPCQNQSYWTFTSVSQGIHTILLRAQDLAQNIFERSVTFGIDSEAPTLGIIHPLARTWYDSGDLLVEWNCMDEASKVSMTSISMDMSEPVDVSDTNTFQFFGMDEGRHNLTITCQDTAGNVISTYCTFYIDTLQPGLDINSPLEGEFVSTTTLLVEWSGVDEGAGVVNYLAEWNGNNYSCPGNSSSILLKGLTAGVNEVSITATDGAGNSISKHIWFHVDTTAPAVKIEYPLEGEYLNVSSLTLIWRGTDSGLGMSHFEFRMDGGDYTSVGLNSSFTIEYLTNGKHTAYVKGVDRGGSSNVTSVMFTIDRELPWDLSIIINNGNEKTFSLELNLALSALDNISGVTHMRFSHNGEEWGEWEKWNPIKTYTYGNLGGDTGPGEKTLYFMVKDGTGNMGEHINATIEFVSGDMTRTGDWTSDPSLIYFIMGVLIASSLVIILIPVLYVKNINRNKGSGKSKITNINKKNKGNKENKEKAGEREKRKGKVGEGEKRKGKVGEGEKRKRKAGEGEKRKGGGSERNTPAQIKNIASTKIPIKNEKQQKLASCTKKVENKTCMAMSTFQRGYLPRPPRFISEKNSEKK